MRVLRKLSSWTAVLALGAGGVLASGGVAAAASPAQHGLAIQAPGDKGWSASSRPGDSTFGWSPAVAKGQVAGHAPAYDPHAKVVKELTSRRTANSDFYQLSDGRVQEKVSAGAVNFRDARGVWQPISTRVSAVSGHGGFTVGATANSFSTYFSGNASSLVRLEQGSAFVEMGADGARSGAPLVSGSTVTYPSTYPGVELQYQVTAQGVKEQIVLSKAPAPGASFAFTLKVGGFVPRQLPGGAIGLYGTESADPVFVIPAPYMADAHPDASSPYGVSYSAKVGQSMSFDKATGVMRLTVKPDAAWLTSSSRVFPVVIDPTIEESPTPSTASNVMILADGPTTNYSTSWRLSVGTTATGAARTLIKFPTPSIPAGTTITSASLNLYWDQYFTTGTNSVSLEAEQANAAWNATTATWSNANSIGGTVLGTATKGAGVVDQWNDYSVTSAVQAWVNGTATNNGFVVRAVNESTLNQGGPRYEASIYAYGGEVVNYPQLVVTYGVPGVTVNAPSVITATGADLTWPAYVNNSGNSGYNIAEYQVHRSVYQSFTPSASTEVAPVASGTTGFNDTTATPTPANNSDPYGNAYYYMVVVKTANGTLIPSPTQLVRLPEAGRITVLIPASSATTISSSQPTTVINSITDTGVSQSWLEVGDNSGTYGTARAIFNFPALSQVPAGSQVLDAHLKVWQEQTYTGTSGAVYELHGLTKAFTGTQATWDSAATGTAWTSAGGDYNTKADGTVSGLTDDPNRQNFDATSIVQGWVNTPTTADGLMLKLSSELSTAPQEHTLFASPSTSIAALAPTLVVTYLAPTTSSTYYAPSTPAKMQVGTTYTVPVTVNNTTSSTWSNSNEVLTYHWTAPDGTDVTAAGNQLTTALPAAGLAPGATTTLNAQVTPPTPTDTNTRDSYTLAWDMKNTTAGTYLSGSNGIGSLKQATGVEEPGSNQLGLDQFYQYTTTATGAGSALYTNASSGNTVWNDNLFSNPSRGFATFLRLSYNSLDTTDTTTGPGWTIQASTPTRLGQALDFHPNPNPTEVTLDDGTGTSHVWTWNSTNSTWTSPPGVHEYLQQLATCGPQVTNARAWSMTRPDGTVFYYDCEGYPTAVVDANGNDAEFTYSDRQSQNKPEEFLSEITDPTGRQTLTVNYNTKGSNYSYIDSTGTLQTDTNLTNPAIIDHVSSMVDISGRTVDFYYTTQGLLARVVDGAGTSVAKTFNFTYDATQGMKNVKLVAVQDPRADTTNIAYYPTSSSSKWLTQTITDRLTHATNFAYVQPGTITGAATQTTVTDANNHAYVYQLDSTGRMIQAVNPLNQKTTLTWDGDNNVASLTEDNGAVTKWSYDPNTGYPLTQQDALAVKNNTASTTYTYQTSLSGHVAYVTDKVSAAGRHYHFTYDANGNLLTVQSPDGTAAGSGYTTTYTYDSYGEELTAKDANGHTTTYSNYDVSGYPDTTKDAVGNTTSVVYGPRGEVTSSTDGLLHTTTQTYDTFLRPLVTTAPKDQANNVYITTPAPVYDANDNVVQKTAPNGAVSTATYNADDEATASTLPPDTTSSPARTTTYTYDNVGNRLTVTQPDGNVSGAQSGSYTTTKTYDNGNEVLSSTDATGGKTTYSYDDVGNQLTVTDPVKNAITGNTTATTTTAYDIDHEPTSVTDAAGKSTSTTYDLDGTKLSTTDQNGNTTLYSYDQNGQLTQQQVPVSGSGSSIVYDTTQYQFDQVGNQTAVISPRGVASGIANAYTTKTSYDADNRKSAVFGAYNPNDATYNAAPETDYSYDAAGRVTSVTAPPSGGSTIKPVTSTSYFDNGWIKSSTDPFGITTTYDYNALGNQTSRVITSAGGSSSRTMGWAYYPDGTVQTQTDSGIPVGLAVEMVDNSDTQNTTSTGTWTGSSAGTGYQGYNYQTHAAGTGTDAFTWNLTVPEDGSYTVYAQYPAVTGAATNASYKVNYSGGSSTATVDQTKNTGTWVSLGSFAFTQAGTGQSVVLSQNSAGAVTADAIKIVRNNSGDTQPLPNSFGYTYDANGNKTGVTDNSPGAAYNQYVYGYDQSNRLSQLQEELNSTVKHTTAFTYNPNGQPLTETHDNSSATYTYDARNLLSTVLNKETSSDAGKTTSYTYEPNALVATETKGNNNVVTYTYNEDSSIASQVEKTSTGTLVSSHQYTYDSNGNQTQDVSSLQSADNNATDLTNTATNAYTPANKIETVTNSNGSDNQSYTYDLAGNITAQTVSGTNTANVYDRGRLLSATVGGATASYNYDPFGRTDSVTSSGTVLKRYTYDGFDHVTAEQQHTSSGTATTDYTFDALGRTTTQTDNAGTGNAKTTTFDYLATSTNVADEQIGGSVSKVYQYSPNGERLDQIVHNSDGTETPSYYTYNPHTDVQAITGANGSTTSTYGYSAYGQDNTSQDTGVDKNTGSGASGTTTTQPYNVYRFNSDRIDDTTGNYNMGFRNYDPSLNRFLTRDMYNGAFADLNMTADPYTGNRYSFGGGNPISNIELDGHMFVMDGGGGSLSCGDPGFIGPCAVPTATATPAATPTPAATSSSTDSTSRWDAAGDEYTLGNIFLPYCAGPGCTAANVGAVSSGFGATVLPIGTNYSKIRMLNTMFQSVAQNTGLAQNMSSESADLLASKAMTQSSGLLQASKGLTRTGWGLAGVGGLVSAYGEYNSTNGDWGRTAAVGVTDTGINVAAGYAGTALGGIAADALMGTEIGAAIGGPAGLVVGAAVGAIAGAAISYFGDNVANDTINAVSDLFNW